MSVKRDYRDVTDPNLTIREVLIAVNKGFIPSPFDSNGIVDYFNVNISDASHRVERLSRYGCIKMVSKKRPRLYEITTWGKKCAERWEKEKDDKVEDSGIV